MSGRLRVDLSALQSNFRRYQRCGGDREVAAVVKADAYGLGAAEVSRALAAVGCTSFFVATPEEGEYLRQVLVEADIYVLSGVFPDTADTLVRSALIPVINDADQLALWKAHQERPIAVHVDTGMSRLGFTPDVTAETFRGFQVSLLISHFACADEPEAAQNAQQVERFRKVAASFPGIRTSMGNSAAWLLGDAYQGELGRPGIGLYGADPFGAVKPLLPADDPLEVVARFETRVLQVREVKSGQTIGYGGSFTASENMQIAIVDCGYADGVPRSLSNQGELSFRSQRLPIVGRVSMDMTAVDISQLTDKPVAGDWLECFGDEISVDQVAHWADTISYEVLTGIRPRVPRHYHWG